MSEQTLVERLQIGPISMLCPRECGASVADWLHAERLMDEAADRIAELEAIVEKLPKTADGVPVAPGMKVYDKDFQGYDVTGLRAMDDSSMPSDAYLSWPRVYSTLAAAEAAKEATTK